MIGRRRVLGPGRRIILELALGAGDDGVTAGASLVLAHVGEKRPVVQVTGRVEPVTAALDPAGVVNREP